ncbi:aldehyde ferredoxin oxidoreductase family protein [Chloroflexota bacterium]
MAGGYTGKMLFVDLATGKMREEPLSESIQRDFIGGIGLGVRILYERMKPGADPLGPDNILGFVTGPTTLTTTPASGRFMVVAKSPLTGAWADANSGGFFGPELKAAGYDAVFFTGISPKPVYMVITDGKAELKDAKRLWGKDVNDTDDILKKELGEKYKIACIGPAGETCSLISGVMNEKGRIAARSGVGAVMGSKKLKALAVRGTGKVKAGSPEKLKEVRKQFLGGIKASKFQQGLSAAGTGGGVSFLVKIGDCPVKNWSEFGTDAMPTCNKLDSQNMDKYKIEGYGCYGCPVRCGALVQLKEGPYATKSEVHRPEYETLAALGTMCFIDDIESIIRANELCNLYGLDTIATGSVVAFAMECYIKGLISKKDTDGIDLKWGNGRALVDIIDKMGKHDGFGNVLADGVKKAAEKIGKGSEKYAMHVGGQGIPYHDTRINPARGAIYLADAQPARHVDSGSAISLEQGASIGPDPLLQSPKLEVFGDYQKKGPMYATGAAVYQLLSSAGMCALLSIQNTVPVAEFISAVTGWDDFNWDEGLKAGRRILTLRQAFNAREGVTPEMYKLPGRMIVPIAVGPAAGKNIDFDALRSVYFEAMGWDIKTGKPSRQTLKELGMDKLTADLWK